jgi:putative NADH-flavin reductase
MKVLLLGVTGNVGSRALPALIKHGHTVVAYVRSTNKVTAEMRAVLADVIVGSVTDKVAVKGAILAYNCDAVFHAAGQAQIFGHSKTNEYNTIFAEVVGAIVEARQERSGPAIRTWMMSGFPMLDSIQPPYLIGDYLPLFPEHRQNLALVQTQKEADIAWSLFCSGQMTPRHKTVLISAPDDCSADNVVVKADSPPEWRDTHKWVPLIGNLLNTLLQAGGYNTSMEDPLDFIAADLAKGLQSEFINKRISFKMKMKVHKM